MDISVRREGLVAPGVSLGKSANEPQVQPSLDGSIANLGSQYVLGLCSKDFFSR